MKKILIFFIITLLPHCSFDNKTGIWDSDIKSTKKSDSFKDFKTLYIEKKLFDEIIDPSPGLKIKAKPEKKNKAWLNKDYNNSNNLDNFSYSNLNEIIFKSKKLDRRQINENILFDISNLII